ncbi:MAG TPA: hypothetical protein DCZ92_13735 [Elusimicrobia bacterium]|nr:hypothetical protein [Elusimicrobiota bacterium]
MFPSKLLFAAVFLSLAAGCAGTRGGSGGVTFVHVTDLHVRDAASGEKVARALKEIGGMTPPPAFIFGTGDNVNRGTDAGEVAAYVKAVSGLAAPFFTAAGNHDIEKAGRPAGVMLKDPYYSFDSGPAHFTVLNTFGFDPAEAEWFGKDLEAAALKGKKTVVFAHNILGRDGPESVRIREIAVAHKNDIAGIFAGHWHANRAYSDDGLNTFVTPSLAFGGIDCSPAGFRVVTVGAAGALSWEFVPGGMKGLASVSGYEDAAGGSVRLIARYLDSARSAAAAEWTGGGAVVKLDKVNRYAFAAAVPAASFPARGAVRFLDLSGAVLAETPFEKPAGRAAPVQPGGPWNTFHRDAGRTGATADSPGPALSAAWAADTGGIPFSNSPVYYDGRVYTAAMAWTSDSKPQLSAFDAASGALLWRTELPSDVIHTPTVTAGMLSALTVNGELLTLDPEDGHIAGVLRPAAPLNRVHTPGATAADATGRHLGGTRYHIEADNARGGAASLYAAPEVDDWGATLMSPALYGGHAVLGTLWRDGLWDIDLAKGTAAILGDIKESYGAAPVTDGKTLYVVGDAKLQALDLAGGKTLWSVPGFERAVATPALDAAEGALYAIDGKWRLVKVRAADGAVLWTLDFAGPSALSAVPYKTGGNQVVSSPAVSARCVWAVDLSGGVFCISKEGKILSRYALGAPAASSPAVSGNTLFINALDGFLYALTGE